MRCLFQCNVRSICNNLDHIRITTDASLHEWNLSVELVLSQFVAFVLQIFSIQPIQSIRFILEFRIFLQVAEVLGLGGSLLSGGGMYTF